MKLASKANEAGFNRQRSLLRWAQWKSTGDVFFVS